MRIPPSPTIAAMLALLMIHPAIAADRNALSGTYRVGGETFYDPPASEAQNTHLYIELTGTAARDLYNAMDAPARPDECTGPKSLVKVIDAMQCTRYDGGPRHRCWFGIDVRKQKIVRGVVC